MEMEKGTGTERPGGNYEGWREGGRMSDRSQEVRKKHWCNPGRHGEKGAPVLTPLCLSRLGNDGRGGGCEA